MIEWPEGRRFAFTIIDDTDAATVENVAPLYEVLAERGMRTTKTVWPLAPTRKPTFGGQTLEDPEYRDWVRSLAAKGFEIAFHGAADHTSERENTLRGLDYFREVMGQDPVMHINHFGQAEAMYWGDARLDGLSRHFYRAIIRLMRKNRSFDGHVEGSPHFWGDLCRERVRYVRNFVFEDINTLNCDPMMPYYDSRRPYVPYWFSASSAPGLDAFCDILSPENQDRLVAEGGACILYTHLAFGFAENGRPNPRFVELIDRMSRLPGWFVPASTLLDFLKTRPGWRENVDRRTLRRMQHRWLIDRVRHGTA